MSDHFEKFEKNPREGAEPFDPLLALRREIAWRELLKGERETFIAEAKEHVAKVLQCIEQNDALIVQMTSEQAEIQKLIDAAFSGLRAHSA